ncbi:MAG: 50S ribosomal protein L11 methyltransferase, partial [Oscillospiraceae bacterium]
MDWTDIGITVETKYTELAAAILSMVNAGVYIEDYSDLEEQTMEIAHIDLIDEELLKRDRTKSILHIYISPQDNPKEYLEFIEERLDAEEIPFSILTDFVSEVDWANAWKQHYHPIELSKNLAICPSWEAYTPK